MTVADLRFADQFFAIFGLKTSASPQIRTLPPYKYSIKAPINLYITKNRIKRRLLGLLSERVLQYFVEICRFANFAICGMR